MKTLEFGFVIDADRETVWNTMFTLDTYEKWASAFCEGSTFEGSWDEGARICFLGPGGDGMMSVIAESRPHEFLSIKHLGEIKNGVEDTKSEWASCFENYHLTDLGGSTEVRVVTDTLGDFEEFMTDAWPRALATLKSLSESA